MSRPLSIAIIGAGMGGLATAAALRRVGIDVTVYEQAAQFAKGLRVVIDVEVQIAVVIDIAAALLAHHEDGSGLLAAAVAPGLGTSTAYWRKSGSFKSFKSNPPLACGLALMRRSPWGGRSANSGRSLPDGSNSSSGL